MQLVSFCAASNRPKLGLLVGEKVYDLQRSGVALGLELHSNMNDWLAGGSSQTADAQKILQEIESGREPIAPEPNPYPLLSPVPRPPSCRDAYAFRQHVATARRNRGAEMIPEFDQFPVFYFTNHNSIVGEGDVVVQQDHLEKLDFELEAAIVIGKHGKNIKASEADDYIAGYTIMNDLSARVLQMEEMKLSLGPAKGKDFATVLGPWLVTPDELENHKIETEFGAKYDLRMTAKHNSQMVSDGNLKDMNWSFAEIIERVSYGVELCPGDVIGSGTVGTGCYLELNGSRTLEAKAKGQEYTPVWLKDGDTIELEIIGLGKLTNKIVAVKDNYSILARKKMVEPA